MTNTNMKCVQTILKVLRKKPERESLQHPVSLLPSFYPNLFLFFFFSSLSTTLLSTPNKSTSLSLPQSLPASGLIERSHSHTQSVSHSLSW